MIKLLLLILLIIKIIKPAIEVCVPPVISNRFCNCTGSNCQNEANYTKYPTSFTVSGKGIDGDLCYIKSGIAYDPSSSIKNSNPDWLTCHVCANPWKNMKFSIYNMIFTLNYGNDNWIKIEDGIQSHEQTCNECYNEGATGEDIIHSYILRMNVLDKTTIKSTALWIDGVYKYHSDVVQLNLNINSNNPINLYNWNEDEYYYKFTCYGGYLPDSSIETLYDDGWGCELPDTTMCYNYTECNVCDKLQQIKDRVSLVFPFLDRVLTRLNWHDNNMFTNFTYVKNQIATVLSKVDSLNYTMILMGSKLDIIVNLLNNLNTTQIYELLKITLPGLNMTTLINELRVNCDLKMEQIINLLNIINSTRFNEIKILIEQNNQFSEMIIEILKNLNTTQIIGILEKLNITQIIEILNSKSEEIKNVLDIIINLFGNLNSTQIIELINSKSVEIKNVLDIVINLLGHLNTTQIIDILNSKYWDITNYFNIIINLLNAINTTRFDEIKILLENNNYFSELIFEFLQKLNTTLIVEILNTKSEEIKSLLDLIFVLLEKLNTTQVIELINTKSFEIKNVLDIIINLLGHLNTTQIIDILNSKCGEINSFFNIIIDLLTMINTTRFDEIKILIENNSYFSELILEFLEKINTTQIIELLSSKSVEIKNILDIIVSLLGNLNTTQIIEILSSKSVEIKNILDIVINLLGHLNTTQIIEILNTKSVEIKNTLDIIITLLGHLNTTQIIEILNTKSQEIKNVLDIIINLLGNLNTTQIIEILNSKYGEVTSFFNIIINLLNVINTTRFDEIKILIEDNSYYSELIFEFLQTLNTTLIVEILNSKSEEIKNFFDLLFFILQKLNTTQVIEFINLKSEEFITLIDSYFDYYFEWYFSQTIMGNNTLLTQFLNDYMDSLNFTDNVKVQLVEIINLLNFKFNLTFIKLQEILEKFNNTVIISKLDQLIEIVFNSDDKLEIILIKLQEIMEKLNDTSKLDLILALLNNTCNNKLETVLIKLQEIFEKVNNTNKIDQILTILNNTSTSDILKEILEKLSNKSNFCCQSECSCADLYKYKYLFEDCEKQAKCEYPQYLFNNTCIDITCQGISYLDSIVCSGHGICVYLDECKCRPGYYGPNCQNEVDC